MNGTGIIALVSALVLLLYPRRMTQSQCKISADFQRQSNADMLRAMSDDGIADFLVYVWNSLPENDRSDVQFVRRWLKSDISEK